MSSSHSISFLGGIVDTVVMNPPFGTRKKGADMDFLFVSLKVNMGMHLFFIFIFFLKMQMCSHFIQLLYVPTYFWSQVASQAVYSLHKTSTRDVSFFS